MPWQFKLARFAASGAAPAPTRMTNLLQPPLPDAAAPHWRWRGLHGSARALALAEAVAADSRPWVFIAADMRELERLGAELRFFGGASFPILTLPDWEVLPYDMFSPHPDIVSERLRTLSRLPSLARGILLLSAEACWRGCRRSATCRRAASSCAPRRGAGDRAAARAAGAVGLRQRQPGPRSRANLRSAARCSTCFRWASAMPVRVDLLDDRIESIRRFDPESQRSLESLEQLELLPARELPLDAEAVRAFRRRFRERFEGDVMRMPIYRGVSEGIAPPGIEFYLPLFFEATAQISDYLPAEAVIATDLDLEAALERSWQGIGAALRGPTARHRAAAAAAAGGVHRPERAARGARGTCRRQHRALRRQPTQAGGRRGHARICTPPRRPSFGSMRARRNRWRR